MAEIRALTFDVFGTVVDWRGSVAREAAAVGKAMGLERDWFRFAEGWRARYQPAMEKVRSGARPWANLDALHRENLDDLLAEFGMDGLDGAGRDHLNRAWHRLDPWPEAVAGLTRLKTKYILATLSNGNVALIVEMAKRAGLPWDAVLGAEVAQAYKPQPHCYLTTARLLGLAPEQCLMTAAHNSDLHAAKALGFRTAFVHRPSEYGPGQTTDLAADAGFDFVAQDFVDLARQLGC